MSKWTIVSTPAIRRCSRVVLFLGGMGVATGVWIASGPLPAEWFAKKEPALTSKRDTYPTGFAELARSVKPAVIAVLAHAVEVEGASRPHGSPEVQKPRFAASQGSGFFITADGYAVTNNHVVKGSASVEVRTDEGGIYRARVIGTDPVSDLAVIKVDGRDDFAHVTFADSPPHVGDWIIAVGNPFGLGGTVTAGIVSARGRDVEKDSYEDLLQIDAPVNRGNSGGPTFDIAGNVIGVNTIILSPTGGSIGIAFAIPSDRAKLVVEQLKEKGAVTRGWLGIQFQSVLREIADSLELPDSWGILIADVQAGGPAASAGLAVGDLVSSINGAAIKDAHDFSRKLDAAPPDSTIVLGVRKGGQQKSIAVTVGRSPVEHDIPPPPTTKYDEEDRPPLGLKLHPKGQPNGAEEHGVMVVGIEPGGLAATRGIEAGDVILDVADQPVEAPDDVYKLARDAKEAGKRSILMRIKSGDTAKFVALPIG